MSMIQEPLRGRPKCRVELHVHLDGSIRHETIWEIMRKKGMKLPGSGSLEDLKRAIVVQEPKDLEHYLTGFQVYMPAFCGDLDAIERIAYEFVEDKSNECVAYCEARFCPQFLLPPDNEEKSENAVKNGYGAITTDQIVETVLKGLKRGEKDFGTKMSLILCCIRGFPEFCKDNLRLCEKYKDEGVVGIDIAGDEAQLGPDCNLPIEKEVFRAAKEKGIHRTAHAGEMGPAAFVEKAVTELYAERIGHGYRVVEDEDIYQRCITDRVHFEACPYSSFLTNSAGLVQTESKRHPILRFEEDNASYSINTDDCTVGCGSMDDQYRLLQKWGYTEAQIVKANVEAAVNTFLPEKEKSKLLETILTACGLSAVLNRNVLSAIDNISVQPPKRPSRVSSSSAVKEVGALESKILPDKPDVKGSDESRSVMQPEKQDEVAESKVLEKSTKSAEPIPSSEIKCEDGGMATITTEVVEQKIGVEEDSLAKDKSDVVSDEREGLNTSKNDGNNPTPVTSEEIVVKEQQFETKSNVATNKTEELKDSGKGVDDRPPGTSEIVNAKEQKLETESEVATNKSADLKVSRKDRDDRSSSMSQEVDTKEQQLASNPDVEKKEASHNSSKHSPHIEARTAEQVNGDLSKSFEAQNEMNGEIHTEKSINDATPAFKADKVQDSSSVTKKSEQKGFVSKTAIVKQGSFISKTEIIGDNAPKVEEDQVDAKVSPKPQAPQRGVKLSYKPSFRISSWDDRWENRY